MPERRETADRTTRVIEDQLALKKVIDLVSGEEAKIAVHYYVDGMSQNEISDRLNVPRRTVGRSLEHFCERARRLLKLPVDPDAVYLEPDPTRLPTSPRQPDNG